MVRPITKNPSPILHKRLSRVWDFSNLELRPLIRDMVETMKVVNGIGIAANQVGEDLRVIVVDTKDGPLAFLNPRILYRSFRKEKMEEGCLSVPGIWGTVARAKSLRLVAQDLKGKRISLKATGLFARVIQHEIDHINGTLFIDKTKNLRRSADGTRYAKRKNEIRAKSASPHEI